MHLSRLIKMFRKFFFRKKNKNSVLSLTVTRCLWVPLNCIIFNSTFISPIYTFPWQKTYLFTRQIKVQIGKSTSIEIFIKGKLPTSAGNKHPSVHIFFHGARLFHLSMEKVRVRVVGNGHQNGYSRADTKNNNIYKR